jgi:N-acetylglutamate synthase-like GNAT family acetyltransferase
MPGNTIHPMSNLPSGISFRPAAAADEPAIRALIRSEGLNPLSLHWRNFLLAVDAEGRIAGIGAVKRHGDGSRELASIAVLPAWRGRGVASAVINALLAREEGPLYLTCRETMVNFYQPFGFRKIGRDEMTPYFRRLSRIVGVVIHIFRAGKGPVVMERDSQTRPIDK